MTRLVFFFVLSLSLVGCTQGRRLTLICEHCYCSWGTRDAAHPISCDALGNEPTCCYGDSS